MSVELGVLFVLASAQIPTSAPVSDPSPAQVQRRFEEERFTRAGFPPIPQEATAFRRLVLFDPYGMLPIPGLEIRRRGTGETDLILQYPEWRSDPIPVDAELWDAVTVEVLFVVPQAFARPAPPMVQPSSPPPPPPICHGWVGTIQDEIGRTASFSDCSRAAGLAGDVSVRLVTAAIETQPDCEQDASSAFFAFHRCFGLQPELDDPALETAFAPLRQEWQRLQEAYPLRLARSALNVPQMKQGDLAWSTARDAVEAVKRVQEQRRMIVGRVEQLSYAATTASPADRFKLSRTRQQWADFTNSQDRNYIQLLEHLVAADR